MTEGCSEHRIVERESAGVIAIGIQLRMRDSEKYLLRIRTAATSEIAGRRTGWTSVVKKTVSLKFNITAADIKAVRRWGLVQRVR